MLRAEAARIGGYALGLYGSLDYLRSHGRPQAVSDLPDHRLVYFIPSMLQLDDLDVGRTLLPEMADAVTSTNVFVHIQATLAGAGIGLLPTFLAEHHANLQRVLPDAIEVELAYWTVTRHEEMRRPAVRLMLTELRTMFASISDANGILT